MARALIISGEGFEDSELLVPYYRLLEAGMQVDVASPMEKFKGKHGYEMSATVSLDDVKTGDYDVLVLPGGKAPAKIRDDSRVVAIAREFMEAKKPVAAICHGPQVLVTAGLLKGRTATCYHTVKGELEGAGANYRDEEVVVDGNLVTSRQPGDIPAFMREIMKQLG
jgi:protease I